MSEQPPQYPSYPGPSGDPSQGAPSYAAAPPAPGYAAAPPAPGYAGAAPAGPLVPYASWWSRVGASILDGLVAGLLFVIPFGIGMLLAFKDASTRTTIDPATGFQTTEVTGGVNPLGIIIVVLAALLAFAFTIWNAAYRQGTTGQSLGKKWVGIRVVRTVDGNVLGAGVGFLRWFMAGLLGNLCFLNYLWPLWDERKQTWHDKIVSSVVVQKV